MASDRNKQEVLNEKFKQEVCAVLREQPDNKLNISQFRSVYMEKFKRKLNLTGGKKLKTVFSKLNDVITLTEEDSCHYVQLKTTSTTTRSKCESGSEPRESVAVSSSETEAVPKASGKDAALMQDVHIPVPTRIPILNAQNSSLNTGSSLLPLPPSSSAGSGAWSVGVGASIQDGAVLIESDTHSPMGNKDDLRCGHRMAAIPERPTLRNYKTENPATPVGLTSFDAHRMPPLPKPKSFLEIMQEQQEESTIRKRSSVSISSDSESVGSLDNQHSAVVTAVTEEQKSSNEVKSLRVTGKAGPFEKAFNDSQKIVCTSTAGKARPRRPNVAQINEATQRIICQIARSGKFVVVETVKRQLCREFGVKSLSELGYQKPEIHIGPLSDLTKLQSKVNLYVHAYVMVHSISTLHELSQSLPSLDDKDEFQDLNLGPLVKQPAVYDFFKFPSDAEIPPVTTIQIMRQLKKYMEKEDLWSKKVDLKKFVEYLCEEFNCESPYELGIRIQSIGLAISVFKKSQRSESEKRRAAVQQIEEDLERDIQKSLHKMRKELLGEQDGDLRSLVQKLQDSSISDIIVSIYDCCEKIFVGKNKIKVTAFLKMLTSDKSARRLFELAIHIGCRLIVHSGDDMELSHQENESEEENDNRDGTRPVQIFPPEEDVTKEVMEWLNKANTMDLATLARIEEQVTAHFLGFDNFQSLGYGPFLQFVLDHKDLHEAVEENLAFHPDRNNINDSTCSVPLNHVLDFIFQCGDDLPPKTIEEGLCVQFGVRSVTELGFGNLEKLISKVQKTKHGEFVTEKSRKLVYEAALLVRGRRTANQTTPSSNTFGDTLHVGALGWKDRQAALQALENAPLLDDLSVFTHWNEVFRPMLGDLRVFLKKEGILASAGYQNPSQSHKLDVESSFCALETSSGTLLRITSHTSPNMFRECVSTGDTVGTSGHVVSLVVANGSVASTPLSMLSNHVRSALAKFIAAAPEESEGIRCAAFVLECLIRIPPMLCKDIAREVFLNPMREKLGSSEAPRLLLSCCTSGQQRSTLHLLGMQLGISEWKEDFEQVVSAWQVCNEIKAAEGFIEPRVNNRPVAVVKPCETKLVSQEEETSSVSNMSIEHTTDMDSAELNNEEEAETLETKEEAGDNTTPQYEEDELQKKCLMVIEQIRQEEFGIGIDLGERETKLVKIQREREGRSLHRLSTELYSKDTHFVLELVQNADDNTYPLTGEDQDQIPSLKFIVANDKVTVLNNERGFTEKNIRALCDVGRSTKGAHRYGYIGQKGIGFKSVFRVTDRPEVHSNGYHIRFDAKSGPIGYILPQWIGDGSNEDSEHSTEDKETYRRWTTRIVLPLKEELRGTHKSSLGARFRDVHPSLLIFLHRLRSITIEDRVNNTCHEMKRRDLGDNIMEVTHKLGVDHWLVVKKQLDASKMKEGVETTELALAFPLLDSDDETGATAHSQHGKSLPQQSVFAFLPLRSYGFRFIIQGDFEVPSSREDVDGDKAWNQSLREEIPLLFVEALDEFRNHPKFQGLSSLKTYFHFVPLEDEILDFFAPVARNILKLLQGTACVPVERTAQGIRECSQRESKSADNHDRGEQAETEYDWVKPCDVVDTDDDEIHHLIGPAMLQEHLGLHYLNREISNAINPVLKASLGIKRLTTQHLIEIGKQETKKVAADGELKVPDIPWRAKWLWCVYRSMEHEHDSSKETLDSIASIPLFPLVDGSFVHLTDDSVFYPLSLGQGAAPSAREKSNVKATVHVLEKDLPVLHGDLFSSLESIGRSQVAHLLKQLGVKSWTPKDVINSHILPTLKSDKWKSKAEETVRSYIVYIFAQRSRDPSVCDMKEVKQCAQVLTNKGLLNPSTTPVHFTPKYGNSVDLQHQLPSASWTLLDNSYPGSSLGTPQDWEKFFAELGVVHFVAIERKQVKLPKNSLARSPWAKYEGIWPSTPDGCYIVEDYSCPELEELLGQDLSPGEARELAQCLDRRWSTEYSQFAGQVVSYTNTHGRHLGYTESSFYINLVSKPWMCTDPQHNDSTGGVTSMFSVPKELYLKVVEVKSLLGNHVPYVAATLYDQSFVEALHIKKIVNLELLLKEMHRWSSSAGSHVAAGNTREFVTPLEQMKQIYKFLFHRCRQSTSDVENICGEFQTNSLVFVPLQSQNRAWSSDDSGEIPRSGRFYQKKEVCWHDPTGIALKLLGTKSGSISSFNRELLHPHYHEPEIQQFFHEILKIDRTPNTDEYIALASAVVEGSGGPTPSLVADVFRIFTVLGGKDSLGKPENKAWLKGRLKHEEVFPCNERWASLNDTPLIPDDPRLTKIFQKQSKVLFIDLAQTARKCGVERTERSWFFYTVGEHVDNKRALNEEMAKLLTNGKHDSAMKLTDFLAACSNVDSSDIESFLSEDRNMTELPDGEEKWAVAPPRVPTPTPPPEEVQLEDNFPMAHRPVQKQNDGDLHSWPPKSSTMYHAGDGAPSQAGPRQGESIKMWPPPAPPESVPPRMASTFFVPPDDQNSRSNPPQAEIEAFPVEKSVSTRTVSTERKVDVRESRPQDVTGVSHTSAQQHEPSSASLATSTVPTQPPIGPPIQHLQATPPRTSVAEGDPSPPRSSPKTENGQFILFSPQVCGFDGASEEFEELPTRHLPLPNGLVLQDGGNKDDVGRWGEMFVFEYLKKQKELAGADMNIDIEWMNEAGNTTAPYDFVVRRDVAGTSGSVATFIEVKSTRSQQKETFEISCQELALAIKEREAFHVYRVFGAGAPGCIRLLRIRNLARQLDNKTVKLCMVI